MIIQLTGNVTFPITLDPTVWIFDDRKLLFDQAFEVIQQEDDQDHELNEAADRFAREFFIKPPVNKSISRFEGKKVLENTYVMPIRDFIETSEIKSNAKQVKLETGDQQFETITIEQLTSSLLLFAKDGKPIKEDGPVHLYFEDGSNKDNPIKGIKKIIIE